MEQKLRVPYGITNFESIRSEGYYFLDKTKYIEKIEQFPSRFVFYLRPRKFGKSLLISMLEYYYDINKKHLFETLFKGTYIYDHPTPEHNSYMTFFLSFSSISIEDQSLTIQGNFSKYIQQRFRLFLLKYGLQNKYEYLLDKQLKPSEVLEQLVEISQQTGQKLYLLIDEYDNFLNEVLVNYGQHPYMEMTHGTGFIRDFFKKIKDMTQEYVIDRIFITGVTPMVMNDLTSGFNIGKNISVEPLFAEMTGITEQELEQVLDYFVADHDLHKTVKQELQLWYDGYSFNPYDTSRKIYNTTLVWYYMLSITSNGKPPLDKLDPNLMTDFGKLRFLLFINERLNGNFSVIKDILVKRTIRASFKENFYIGEDLRMFDSDKFISLLYYLGLLTIKSYIGNTFHFTIPNLVTEEMFWNYLREGLQLQYKELRLNVAYLREQYEYMALEGRWRGVFEYILNKFYEVVSVRDFIFREEGVKMFFLAYLQMSDFYIIRSESEQSQGFADIYLEPKYPEVKWRYLIEFKYVKKSNREKLKVNSEMSENEGSETSSVIKKVLERAKMQLERYRQSLAQVPLKCIIVIAGSQQVLYMDELNDK